MTEPKPEDQYNVDEKLEVHKFSDTMLVPKSWVEDDVLGITPGGLYTNATALPNGEQIDAMRAARQQFERGFMLWFDCGGGIIFAIADDGWWRCYADEWDGKSEPMVEPPIGKIKPLHGFGDVWAKSSEVVEHLGWATTGEEAGRGECGRDEKAWHITFGDDYSATLEYPVEPEPEPSSSTDWVWLPTLDMPLNLAFIAFVNKHGVCHFGPYDMLLTLPSTDAEFVREELRKRCKPLSSLPSRSAKQTTRSYLKPI